MFQDVIDILLQKKAELRAEIEREFAERSNKIDKLLADCGYEEPVAEAEPIVGDVVSDEVAEVAAVEEAAPISEEANSGEVVY